MENIDYRAVLEYSPGGYAYHKIILGTEGKPKDYVFLDINAAFENITGLKREDILGKTITEIMPDICEDGFDWIGCYGETALNGGSREFEEYNDSLGKWFHVTVYSPKEQYFVTWLNDITNQKNSEIRLQKNEEQLRFAMEATSDGLWDWNMQTGYIYWSPRAYTMLGYEPDEFEMNLEHWKSLLHPEDKNRILMQLNRQLYEDALNTFVLEFRYHTKQNTWKWIVGRGKVVEVDNEGKPLRMVGTHVDISERKKMEIELRHSKEQAEAANMVKTAFLANMSHELRTPINGMYGMLQLLDMTELNKEQKECVHDCRDACKRLQKIISNLLEMTIIQTDEVKFQESQCSTVELLEKVSLPFKKEALAKGLTLEWFITDDVPHYFVCDEEKISCVLTQLIDNAVKFTESGQIEVTVSIYNDINSNTGNKLIFKVKDTGIGISEEKLDTLFEIFSQIDDSYTKRYQGAGLGLALARNLIVMMDGTLAVESIVGKGSTFAIELPLRL